MRHLLYCRTSQQQVETELELKPRKGERIPALLCSKPITSTTRNGALLYQTAIMDLSERKRAEETMRRAVEFDEAVMKNMGEGLYTVDAQGLVTSMNPAAEKLLGWSFEELRGRKMHDITHHHHPDGRPFPAERCAGLKVIKV